MENFRELTSSEFKKLSFQGQQNYLRLLFDQVQSDNENEPDELPDDDDLEVEYVPDGHCENSDIEDVGEQNEIEVETDEDSDEENENNDTSQINNSSNIFLGKDGTEWHSKPVAAQKILKHNILREKAGPVRATQKLSIRDVFKRIFSNEMCDIIIRETNRKATKVYSNYNKENPTKTQKQWKPLTSEEFDAFLGIIITAGVRLSNFEHTKELWKTDAYPLYRASMPINRFWQLNRFLRFDNDATRNDRLKTNKAAAIADIFEMLNTNLRSNYKPSDSLTIDEQLFPFRGRTKFTQYMPSKPSKYGIKVWWICDSRNSYPLTGQIYTGKSADGREKNQGERVVKDLCYEYKGSGRNIVTDNFFTSLHLARHLMSCRNTEKNKPYIPKEMLPNSTRAELTSLFGFSSDNVTICSYVPKKKKAVVLLSTMHYSDTVSGPASKPEIILYYNSTKGGVDNMDKLCTHYTVKRKTQRWPMAFFYNIIDIAALASYIIYSDNNPETKRETHNRRVFLQNLGKELSMPAIYTRSKNVACLRRFSTKSGIECMLGKTTELPTIQKENPLRDATGRLPIQGNCFVCSRQTNKRKRKTRKICAACKKPICEEHCITTIKCQICE